MDLARALLVAAFQTSTLPAVPLPDKQPGFKTAASRQVRPGEMDRRRPGLQEPYALGTRPVEPGPTVSGPRTAGALDGASAVGTAGLGWP